MTCSNRSCRECSPTMPEQKSGRPKISIHCGGTDPHILIGYETVIALGNPAFITMLVNWEVPSLAIMECKPEDSMSFKVLEYRPGRHFRIYGKSFVDRLSEVIGIPAGKGARFYGVYDSEKKAVIFNFLPSKDAEEKPIVATDKEDVGEVI